MIQLSLLNILHPSPVVGPSTCVGMSAVVWARQPSGLSSEALEKAKADTAKDRVGFGSLQKSRKNSGPIFIALGQKTLNEQVLPSA